VSKAAIFVVKSVPVLSIIKLYEAKLETAVPWSTPAFIQAAALR